MSEQTPFTLDAATIAPGVVETIISLAAAEVEGVAGVGAAGALSSIAAAFKAGKAVPTQGLNLAVAEDGSIAVEITIQVAYGFRIVEVADNVRTAISQAIAAQLGAEVSSVDIFVDGLAAA